MRSKNLHVVSSNALSREDWSQRIGGAWQEQVSSILEVGILLETAKQELGKREWGAMCREDLPFTPSTARRVLAIAANENFRSHVNQLPAHWGTLYQLTKLTTEQFEQGIASGAINPKMQRRDVAAMLGIEPKRKPEPAEPADPQDADVPDAQDPIGSCSMRVINVVWQTLAHLDYPQREMLFDNLGHELGRMRIAATNQGAIHDESQPVASG